MHSIVKSKVFSYSTKYYIYTTNRIRTLYIHENEILFVNLAKTKKMDI